MDLCAQCYQFRLPACNGKIYVVPGITFTNLFWLIKDKFGNEWTGECTPSYTNSGAFYIDPSLLPEGLFKPFSGTYTLQVVNMYQVVQTMTFAGNSYKCVEFDFFDAFGNDLQSQIQ